MTFVQMPCACTIAGSDCGGGAGIQADLKTFSAFDVWGCSVIAALTAQNPEGVLGIVNTESEFVALQMQAVLEGFDICAFKTGMLPTPDIIKTVGRMLPKEIPLVVDPVMVSTSGNKLCCDEALFAMEKFLLSRCTLITPNIPEACALSGLDEISSEEDIISAAEIIQNFGAQNVLIKGGHMKGRLSVDYLFGPFGMSKLTGERFSYEIHGSGCSLSAAIAAGLCRGMSVEKSCCEAKKFIESSIRHAFISKTGHYSVNPVHFLRI